MDSGARRLPVPAVPRPPAAAPAPRGGSARAREAAAEPGAARGLRATLLFHLNLDYSAIEVEDRPRVVERCYRPLLALAERGDVPCFALEAPLHTLELVAAIDPAWLERLRALVAAGRVELVGSGDTQLAGPLVPASVNRWNQELGRRGYRRLVGVAPTTALVGEMAFSQGLVDHYLDAGYDALVVEWNNARRAHPEWPEHWSREGAWTASPLGRRIAVRWVDTLWFQRFQRCVSGEISPEDHRAWVARRALAAGPEHLGHAFLYAGDAEVIGFRPGRYEAEPALEHDEWTRVAELVRGFVEDGVVLTTPARLAREPDLAPRRELTLCTALEPVPVKKQPKYNVTRWGLSGRDDLGQNAACHARARALEAQGGGEEEWRALCRAWSSDLRTHLTARRWEALERLPAALPAVPRAPAPENAGAPLDARVERAGSRLAVATEGVALELDLRRGLALSSLAFPRVAPEPLVGTLPHGALDDIDWAADFYSGHTVIEIPAKKRVTDLGPAEPRVERRGDHVLLEAEVATGLGPLRKRLRVFAGRVELEIGLAALGERPLGIVRAGFVTLLPDGWQRAPRLFVRCASGGAPERYPLDGEIDHGAAVSSLVSARTAFGASDGRLVLEDGAVALVLDFPPERCAALPLLTHRFIGGRRFCRVALSLGEIDETLVPGAPLCDLVLGLEAARLGAEAA